MKLDPKEMTLLEGILTEEIDLLDFEEAEKMSENKQLSFLEYKYRSDMRLLLAKMYKDKAYTSHLLHQGAANEEKS